MPGNGTNKTTGLVSTYRNGSDAAYSYTYDDNGNITEITQGTTSITYEYDTANRLTRENNQVTNETITYEYDVWGNILNRKVYAYTTGDLTNVPYTEIEYEYTNTAWGDQLTSYDNVSITYDDMGNPLTYRGYTFGWRGKQLVSAGNGTDTTTYEYNADGLRQKKTVNNVDTDYFYNGSVLIGMQQNNDVLRFSYDASGSVVSVNYNGTEYYYLRNAQGDIVKLIDASGATVVEYTYDTWGKEVQITGSLAGTLGSFQPFRYRGYVYDEETGLYYLQSRYYDPTTGRFISADVLLSTGQGVLGYNAFVYCNSNPISRIDSNGHFWEELWEFAQTAASEIGKAIGVLSPAYASCGGVALADGPLPFGDAIGLVGAGLITIGAICYGIYEATQAPAVSIPKIEEKEIDIAPALPASTIIYRYGGTNPGNLTPKAKDKYTGLSFSTVPMSGAAMTTIEALNATGLVYAVRDGATHVSVRPIGGTMEDWINAGSTSIWTQAVKSVVIKYVGVE